MKKKYDPDNTPGTIAARKVREKFNKLYALDPVFHRIVCDQLQKDAMKVIYQGHPIEWFSQQILGRHGCIAQYWAWFWKWRHVYKRMKEMDEKLFL